MSSILASVSVLLGAEISEFKAKMAEARRELKGLVQFSEGLKDVGKSLTTYVTAPLLALGAGAVLASGKVESLRNALTAINTQDLAKQGTTGLAAMAQAADLTRERMKALEVLARQPGLGFEQAVQGDVRLRAVGISAEQSAKSLKSFANAIALTGGGKSEFASVTVQLAQLSAKGKVLAQDLRPIIEAAPAVSGALQKLYGTVDSETISASLQKQGKSSTDFIAILTEELGKLPQVTGSLKNSLENFGDTATLSLAKIGDGISKALNLPAVLASVSDFVSGLADRFENLSPGAQKVIVVLAGIAAATGPVLVAVGALGAALPAITAGFAVLGVSSLAALGPLVPVVGAVAAAAFLVVENWERVAPIFVSLGNTLGGVFESLRRTVTEIGQGLAALGLTSEVAGKAVRLLGGVLTDQLVLPLRLLAGALDVAVGGLRVYIGVMSGDFKAATAGGAQALDGLKLGLLGIQKEAVSSAADFRAFFKDVIEGSKELVEGLSGGDIAAALGASNGLLAELEERLKGLKEVKPTLTTEVDIAAINQQIAGVEAQIKRLNELGIGSQKMADAWAAVQRSLRLVVLESRALAGETSLTELKIAALEAGIKKLVEAGFSPYGKAVSSLARQHQQLNAELGATQNLQGKLVGLKLPDGALPTALAYSKKTDKADPFFKLLTDREEALKRFAANMKGLTEQLNTSVGPLLADFAGQFGDAFGSILTNTASVGDAMAQLFSGVIGALASFMGEFGKQLIVIGIGKLALDTLFDGPQGGPLAIAAGLGLVALAGVAKGIASGASSSLKGIGSGGVGSASTNYSRGANYGQSSGVNVRVTVEPITVRASGADLVGVSKTHEYRQFRTG